MDSIDKAIIKALQANSRLTNQDLSEQVGLSPSPCLRRVRQLEQQGIITGYTARIDQQKLGWSVTAFVSVKLERQIDDRLHQFEQAILACPQVTDCFLMTGTRDYLLTVVARDLTNYEHFLTSTLTKIEGVASIESSLALRRVKGPTEVPIS